MQRPDKTQTGQSILLTDALHRYRVDGMRTLKPPSVSTQNRQLDRFAEWVADRHDEPVRLADLTADVIRAYTDTFQPPRVTRSTASSYRGYIRRFFDYCKTEGLIDSNPAYGLSSWGPYANLDASPVPTHRCPFCDRPGNPFTILFSARGVCVYLCPEHALPLLRAARRGKPSWPARKRARDSPDHAETVRLHPNDDDYGDVGRQWGQRRTASRRASKEEWP